LCFRACPNRSRNYLWLNSEDPQHVFYSEKADKSQRELFNQLAVDRSELLVGKRDARVFLKSGKNYIVAELENSILGKLAWRPGAGLRREYPQEPRLGIPRGGDSGHDAALRHVAGNLPYTGVTRGKRLVVLVGQKKAVAIAVRNVSGRRRWSKLSEWLRAAQQFE
jgi:hypothetical protein